MKTIPFDINKAKAGAKVVTREGYPVRIITYELGLGLKTLAGVVNFEIYVWHGDGKYLSVPYGHGLDLFLQEEPKYVPFNLKTIPLLKAVQDKNKIAGCDTYLTIGAGNNQACFLIGRGWINYTDLLKYYTFVEDDSLCGTLVD